MFDDTTPNQNPNLPPAGGPLPGEPMQPISASVNVRPGPSTFQTVAPSTPPPLPPLPPNLPMEEHSGGRMKRIILIAVIVLLLVAAGIAVAFLLPTSQTANTNTTTNTTTNLPTSNTNALTNLSNKTNANATTNLNTTNAGTNVTTNTRANTNSSTGNVNKTNTNTTANVNTTTNSSANANSSANTNKATNTTTNTTNATNAATNSSSNVNTTNTAPASYTTDTDNDSFNNYLEVWMLTNKKTADSDGDTFLDGKEVSGGYSPLSKGKLSVAGLEAYCTTSPVVTQYGLSSTDIQTFCGIAGDVLSKIQIMTTNAAFYEDLDSLVSRSCTSFGKIDSADCAALVKFLIPAYAASNSAS